MPDRPPPGAHPASSSGESGGDSGGDSAYSWLYGGSRGSSSDPDRTQATRPPAEPDAERTQRVRVPPSGAPTRSSGAGLPPMQLPPPGLSGTRKTRPAPSGASASSRARGSTGSGTKGASRPRIRWARVLSLLLVVWVLFLLAVPVYAWARINRVDAQPDGDRPTDQPGTTYLLVGSDSREGLDDEQRDDLSTGGGTGGSRTDTILLLHVGDGKPLLLSIPRDSPVDIPGHGSGKINAAFNSEVYDGGGPQLLVETIEANTGIRVDDYVEVGFGGFVDVVDALGGIEICPEAPIDDPLAGLDLEAGCQEADGATALGFARTRSTFALQDLARVQNQREVIASIGAKAASPWTVLNPWRYWSLAGAGASSLTIGENVGPLSLARFAWTMARVGGNGLSCTVPVVTSTTSLEWDPELAPRVFEAVAEDRTGDITNRMCRPAAR